MALRDYIGAAASAFGNRFSGDYGAQLISNVSNRYKQGGIAAAAGVTVDGQSNTAQHQRRQQRQDEQELLHR